MGWMSRSRTPGGSREGSGCRWRCSRGRWRDYPRPHRTAWRLLEKQWRYLLSMDQVQLWSLFSLTPFHNPFRQLRKYLPLTGLWVKLLSLFLWLPLLSSMVEELMGELLAMSPLLLLSSRVQEGPGVMAELLSLSLLFLLSSRMLEGPEVMVGLLFLSPWPRHQEGPNSMAKEGQVVQVL